MMILTCTSKHYHAQHDTSLLIPMVLFQGIVHAICMGGNYDSAYCCYDCDYTAPITPAVVIIISSRHVGRYKTLLILLNINTGDGGIPNNQAPAE